MVTTPPSPHPGLSPIKSAAARAGREVVHNAVRLAYIVGLAATVYRLLVDERKAVCGTPREIP
jgi:hypothetical protein